MAVYKEANGTWTFRVYVKGSDGVNKQYKRRGFKTKKEAQQEERLFVLMASKPKPTQMTIKELGSLYIEYIKKLQKKSTVDYKIYILDEIYDFFKDSLVEALKAQDFLNYQSSQQAKGISNSRINKKVGFLKAMFEYGVTYCDIQNNEYKKIPKLKEAKVQVKDKHIEKAVFDKFLQTFTDDQEAMIFELMYKTGMRVAEAQALQWKDINWNAKEISVTKQVYYYKDGKGDYTLEKPKSASSIRTIDICNSLFFSLLDLYQQQTEYRGFTDDWFVLGNIKPLCDTTINNIRTRHCNMIGVYFDNHSCRHSYGSNLIADGFDVSYVSAQMGHESMGVTLKVYTHLLDKTRQKNKKMLENY